MGLKVGLFVGDKDSVKEGLLDNVGLLEGYAIGLKDGLFVGDLDGFKEGVEIGLLDGYSVGLKEGLSKEKSLLIVDE